MIEQSRWYYNRELARKSTLIATYEQISKAQLKLKQRKN